MAIDSAERHYSQTLPGRLSGTKLFFITLMGVVVGIFVFLFLLFFFFASIAAFAGGDEDTQTPIVLELDLRTTPLDSPLPVSLFGDNPASVVEIVRSLDRAKSDDQVKGVFIRGENMGMAPASAEELRLALHDFRESGKFVITHAQGLNSTSIVPFHAISASDEIWVQPGTSVFTSGLYSQSEFLGGTLAMIDAQPEFFRHGDYKNAVNTYTQTGFTPEHREATTSLLQSVYDETIDNIAVDLILTREEVLQALSSAPHSAQSAYEAGLVDRLGYLEEAKTYVSEKAGDEDTIFKPISTYKPKGHYGEPVIALIEGQGVIMPGSSGGDGVFNSVVNMGGETLADAIDTAAEDEDVKAILFRVSSGGGSAAASDQILAAVKRAQEAGKPVIVSMGQYAASGGYYVSASADHIVAMPQTITGSIGIYGGKLALEETFAKVGYNIESIRLGGEFAGAFNGDEPFTEAQRDGYAREIKRMYDDFIGIVADGRNMSREEVLAIAEGRVWTGAQALDRGLVDELGGFETALNATKRLAEIDEDSAVQIKRFPQPKTREQLLNELFSGTVDMGQDLDQISALLDRPEVQTLMRLSQDATARSQEMQATLPTIR
jgi:protease-4